MVTPPTPQQTLADLARAFPRQPVDPETLRVYLRDLADVDAAALDAAARHLIRTARFFPLVSEIREAVAERTLGLPGEAHAVEQVHARISWGRADEAERGDPPPIHPLVLEALAHVGGFAAFRTADDPGVVRGQFLRLYRDLRSAAVRDIQTGDLAALSAGRPQRALPPPEPPAALVS